MDEMQRVTELRASAGAEARRAARHVSEPAKPRRTAAKSGK
jgi:hypothetical protein